MNKVYQKGVQKEAYIKSAPMDERSYVYYACMICVSCVCNVLCVNKVVYYVTPQVVQEFDQQPYQ